jgi:methionyl aminopeptidase
MDTYIGFRMIRLKTPEEIRLMRASGKLAAQTLEYAGSLVSPGVSTLEIDTKVREFILDHGAYPSPLNYPNRPTDPRRPKLDPGGFPCSICTSVNEVVTHGIPSARKILMPGDIVNLDITVTLDGYHGDCSATFFVGEPSPEARHLVETTKRCLDAGIDAAREGGFLGDIGSAIQEIAESEGYGVVREYCGHGIGRRFHEEPSVLHYRDRQGPRLRRGMIFTIEPMINQGGWKTRLLDDGWTAVTADGRLSAQFEHTVALTENGTEILTRI